MANRIHKKRGQNIQGKRKRLQLLEASGKCFAKLGYNGTTIRDIAKEANVQPSALIYHFKSKEALYAETLRFHIFENQKLQQLFETFGSMSAENPQGISDAIFEAVRAIIFACHAPRVKIPYLNGLLISLITEGDKETVKLIQKQASEYIEKGFSLMRRYNASISDTDFFWWDHFFWSMILYPIYGETMLLSHSGEKKYSEEFLTSYVGRVSKVCCNSAKLPMPTQLVDSEKWEFKKA